MDCQGGSRPRWRSRFWMMRREGKTLRTCRWGTNITWSGDVHHYRWWVTLWEELFRDIWTLWPPVTNFIQMKSIEIFQKIVLWLIYFIELWEFYQVRAERGCALSWCTWRLPLRGEIQVGLEAASQPEEFLISVFPHIGVAVKPEVWHYQTQATPDIFLFFARKEPLWSGSTSRPMEYSIPDPVI